MYYCYECNEGTKMVGKVFNHRYGMTERQGFITSTLHNWDSKTFDDSGYPVADCGARCFPRRSDLVVALTTPAKCKECFK